MNNLNSVSKQVLRSVRADRSLTNDGLASALLVVYLDSAKNLPVSLCDADLILMQPLLLLLCDFIVGSILGLLTASRAPPKANTAH